MESTKVTPAEIQRDLAEEMARGFDKKTAAARLAERWHAAATDRASLQAFPVSQRPAVMLARAYRWHVYGELAA